MPGTVPRHRRRTVRVLLAGTVAAVAAAVGGCAQFPAEQPRSWQPQPTLQPQAGPQPQLPGQDAAPGGLPGGSGTSGDPNSGGPPKRNGCQDSDPMVIATCVNPVYALAVLPGNTALLAAERSTGRILRVQKGQVPVQVASLPVDSAGGGGLTGLALSPSYAEDQLIYAYITTPTDNRIVRLAPNDVPKPLVTGIPRGTSDNAGALTVDDSGALLAATGDAGDPARAADESSLAGKVLRVDTFGKAPADNPRPGSPVFASGLHAPAGLCSTPGGGAAWVTDSTAGRDLLYRLKPGPLQTAAWNWPGTPAVGGCIAGPGFVSAVMTNPSQLFRLQVAKGGNGFTGQPQVQKLDNYGRVRAVTVGPDGAGWGGTVNKEGGKTVSSDDRVFRLPDQSQGGGVD